MLKKDLDKEEMKPETPVEVLAVSAREAAKMLGVGETKVREMVREKILPGIWEGRRLTIPKRGVELYVERALNAWKI